MEEIPKIRFLCRNFAYLCLRTLSGSLTEGVKSLSPPPSIVLILGLFSEGFHFLNPLQISLIGIERILYKSVVTCERV